MRRDRRRADVDRDAVGAVVEAGPGRRDGVPVVDRHRDLPVALAQRASDRADDLQVGIEVVEVPLAGERVLEPPEIARRRRQGRRLDLDVVEPDDRVELERALRRILAHDLAVDLALGRDVDDDVAAHLGQAPESALRLHASE